MLPADDASTLALLYHLNSEPWMNQDAADAPVSGVRYKEINGSNAMLQLPQPQGEGSLTNLLRGRHSCRSYLPREMPVAQLASLLAGSYGITRCEHHPDGSSFLERSVPSAGGFYPLEVYAVVQRVEALANGSYHYNVLHHALEPLRSGDLFPELSSCLLNQYFLTEANVVIIFSMLFRQTLAKYGARGYRYILMEAGHTAQNLCLLAGEHHLGSLCIGGFIDKRLNQFLGIDGREEAALYCVAIGYPNEA